MASWLLWILRGVFRRFTRKIPNLKIKYGDNSWAIVTGGANGVGRAFC